MREAVLPPRFSVVTIPEGIGFGEGLISGSDADAETMALLEATIQTPDILKPVETDDDGCSDGRRAMRVFTKERTYGRSLNRSKVFGGAVVMAGAARIGLGLADDEQLDEVFQSSTTTLKEKGIKFGAHTAEQAPDGDSGCGAIDRGPEALSAVLKYKARILEVIERLVTDPTGLSEVAANFGRYVGDTFSQPAPYRGDEVVGRILTAGAVVKELSTEHRERRIILNKVRGFTVNQELIRLVTGDEAQVFAVDLWRLEDIAHGLYPDQPDLERQAYLSGLMYTLGTAAVLTKGNLPIDILEETA